MSDERLPFLAAIKAEPDCDLPRLVYADFLDECGDELSRAQAEFIRVSCKCDAKKKRQTSDEGRWLQANWQRLLPSLVKLGVKLERRNGRNIKLVKSEFTAPPDLYPESPTFNRILHVTFWRGFAVSASVYFATNLSLLASATRDCPLATLVANDAIQRWRNGADVLLTAFRHYNTSKNDIWERIEGYQELVSAPNYPPSSKRFLGAYAHQHADKAVSDAIRSWVEATPLTD